MKKALHGVDHFEPAPVHIVAFYRFTHIAADALEEMRRTLKAFGAARDMRGLVLVAHEGINGTICGSPDAIAKWKALMTDMFGEMHFNESAANERVFPRWLVKIREEIVGLKQKDVKPIGAHKHLSPEEWHAMMERDDTVVLDARNDYETAIGAFEGAVDPHIRTFHEFATFAAETDIPKNATVMMYCTGGIRCEKAIIEMEKRGFTDVHQLRGGILAYLKKFPHGKFRGECFVFDRRVAVDQESKPSSTYGLCPHCGDPGACAIACDRCASAAHVCASCIRSDDRRTCSKRCRNELVRR